MTRDEFIKEYIEVANLAYRFNEIARREGLLALEEYVDNDKFKEREIFFMGLPLVVDGTDYDTINVILTNIVNQEKDYYTRKLLTIKKEAILAIRKWDHYSNLQAIMNSYTDLTFNDEKELGIETPYDNEDKNENIETLIKKVIYKAEKEDSRYTNKTEIEPLNVKISELLLDMNKCSLHKVMREMTNEDISIAIRTANKSVMLKFLNNMSKRRLLMFKDNWVWKHFGKEDLIKGKKKLLAIIYNLADTGEIIINNQTKKGE